MSESPLQLLNASKVEFDLKEVNKTQDFSKSHISVASSWSKAKIFPDNNLAKRPNGSVMNSEMKEIVSYFSDFYSKKIHTPIEENFILLQYNKNIFYFGCKSNNLLYGSISSSEKKHSLKFSKKGLRCIELIDKTELLLVKKKDSMIRLQILPEYDGQNNLVDFELKFIQKVKPSYSTSEPVDFMGVKALHDDHSFISLEFHKNKAKINQWSNYEVVKTLHTKDSPGISLEVSEDFYYIATSHEDSSISILNLMSTDPAEIKNKEFGRISALKITKKNKFLVFAGSQIYVYNLTILTPALVINSQSSNIPCLVTTDDERVLISGADDGKIFVWDLHGNIEGFMLEDSSASPPTSEQQVSIKSLILNDSGFLFRFSADGVIKRLKLPNTNQYYMVKPSQRIINLDSMFCSGQNEDLNLLFTLNDRKISKIDIRDGTVLNEKELDEQGTEKIVVDSSSNFFCVIKLREKLNKSENKYEALIYNYKTFSQLKSILFDFSDIENAFLSVTSDLLIISSEFKCKVLIVSSVRELYSIVHKESISKITTSKKQKIIYTGDSSGLIHVNSVNYNFEVNEIRLLESSEFSVSNLWLDPNDVFLIALHRDSSLNIWEVLKGLKINSCKIEDLIDVIFPKDSALMFCLTGSAFKSFHVPSLICYFSVDMNKKPERFCFLQNEELVSIYMGNKLYIYQNPLRSKEILPFGNLDNIGSFYSKMLGLVKGKSKQHDPFFKDWVISPYGINVMHIYSFLDLPEFMKSAFEEDIGFFPSTSGYTPLDISLELVFEDCLDLIYDQLSSINPLKLWVLESSLIKLNLCPYFQVAQFYNLFLLQSIDSTMPKFYNSRRGLPIYVTTPNLLASKSLFMYDYEYSVEGKEVAFKQSYMKIDLIPGSSKSILLARSIGETTNGELFNTEFFKVLIQQKWSKIRFILYADAVINLVFIVFVSLYGMNRNPTHLYVSFAINVWLMIYKGIELVSNPIDFIRDKYGYSEISRFTLISVIFARSLLDYSVPNEVVAILVLLAWFKGLSYYRLIDSTRYFINLLFAVFADAIPFLTVLLIVNIGISVIYCILDGNQNGYIVYLTRTWEINLGGFDSSEYDIPTYIVFFLHTIVIPIILLNLLISIMGDTFDKVNNQLAWADGKEMITMIIEGENIMFWNRLKSGKQYLHYCFEKGRSAKDSQDQVKVRSKIDKIKETNERVMEGIKELNGKYKKILDIVMGAKK